MEYWNDIQVEKNIKVGVLKVEIEEDALLKYKYDYEYIFRNELKYMKIQKKVVTGTK